MIRNNCESQNRYDKWSREKNFVTTMNNKQLNNDNMIVRRLYFSLYFVETSVNKVSFMISIYSSIAIFLFHTYQLMS